MPGLSRWDLPLDFQRVTWSPWSHAWALALQCQSRPHPLPHHLHLLLSPGVRKKDELRESMIQKHHSIDITLGVPKIHPTITWVFFSEIPHLLIICSQIQIGLNPRPPAKLWKCRMLPAWHPQLIHSTCEKTWDILAYSDIQAIHTLSQTNHNTLWPRWAHSRNEWVLIC